MEKYFDKAQYFNWINSNDNFLRNENKIRQQSNLIFKYLNCFNYRFFFYFNSAEVLFINAIYFLHLSELKVDVYYYVIYINLKFTIKKNIVISI